MYVTVCNHCYTILKMRAWAIKSCHSRRSISRHFFSREYWPLGVGPGLRPPPCMAPAAAPLRCICRSGRHGGRSSAASALAAERCQLDRVARPTVSQRTRTTYCTSVAQLVGVGTLASKPSAWRLPPTGCGDVSCCALCVVQRGLCSTACGAWRPIGSPASSHLPPSC